MKSPHISLKVNIDKWRPYLFFFLAIVANITFAEIAEVIPAFIDSPLLLDYHSQLSACHGVTVSRCHGVTVSRS